MQRNIVNYKITTQQWKANAKNSMLGQTPDSYKQAKNLAEKLVSFMEKGEYKNYCLSFCGHSKGGGEAAYAAAMVSTPKHPIKAECFSSAQLGYSMLIDVQARLECYGREGTKMALSKIRHYKIKGDPIPNMHKVLRKKLMHVGTVATLPHSNIRGANNALGYHDHFLPHIKELPTMIDSPINFGK